MRREHFPQLIFFLLLPMLAPAQQVTTEVLSRYPAGVVTRVYDITAVLNLSPERQVVLANHFMQEDSMVTALIRNGAPATSIDSTRKLMHNNLLNLLTPTQANEYYTKKLDIPTRKEGEQLAKWMQQKYGADSSTANMLGYMFYKRQLNIEKVFYTALPDQATLDTRLQKVFGDYDSAITKITGAIVNTDYIKQKISALDSIKTLSAEQKTGIQATFMKLAIQNTKSEADNFNTALHRNIIDTAFYAVVYKDEIQKKANVETQAYLRNLELKNVITKDGAQNLSAVVLAMEWEKAVIGKTYSGSSHAKDNMLQAVTEKYDSLITLALTEDGSKLPSSQFAIAVKYRKSLGLSDDQVSRLLADAALLKEKKDSFLKKEPFGKYDSKAFETDGMTQIVTPEQYTRVLTVKNKSQAMEEAKEDWTELVQRGLAANYDQGTTMQQLSSYYLEKWNTYYLYGNDAVKRNANVKNIQDHAPAVLKVLNAARKYNNPISGDAASSYKW